MDAEGLFYLETKLPEGTLESFEGQGREESQDGEESWGMQR